MATYETRLEEAARFEAVDADGQAFLVIAHRALLHRVSLRAKPFAPVDGGHRYSLADGRALVRKPGMRFETHDGSVQLQALDAPSEDDDPAQAGPAPRSTPAKRDVKGPRR